MTHHREESKKKKKNGVVKGAFIVQCLFRNEINIFIEIKKILKRMYEN